MKPYVFSRSAFPASSPLLGGEDEEWSESGGNIDKNEKEEVVSEEESKVSPSEEEEEGKEMKEVKEEEKTESKVRVVASLATDPAMRSSPFKELPSGKPVEPKEPIDYVSALPPAIQNAIAAGRFLCMPPSDASRTKPPDPPDSRPGLGYLCTPCGIRFSSASTLEAHQTYYCSHRTAKMEPSRNSGDSEGEEARSISGDSKSEEMSKSEMEVSTKALRTGKQYKCPHCSYSADKKVSLNRHMRMHSASPVEDTPSNPATPLVDRYCQDCDIRFSSLKTFRAHKTHYCGTRHAGKPKSPQTAESSSPPPLQPKPFLVLPTNPVLIVPYALVQGASLISGPAAAGITATDTASVLLADGSLQPLPLAISQPHVENATPKNTQQYPAAENKVSKPSPENFRKIEGGREITSPLDLSYRRSMERDGVMDIEDKENRKIVHNRSSPPASPEHEDIICAPSIPLMLSTSSTCSSPSPSPLSPALSSSSHSSKKIEVRKARTDSICNSPSPKMAAVSPSPKSPRSTPNGVITKNPRLEEKKKSESPLKPEANISLQNLLLAAVAQNQMETISKGEYPRLPIPPELVPHLSAMCGRLPDGKPALGLGPLGPLARPPADPALLPYLAPELALRMAELPPPPPPPQVILKQGESKCNECNIVFYRIENFVAHKMYYCGASVKANEEKPPSSPPPTTSPKDLQPKSPTASVPSTSKLPMYQFICAACGIKFTSYDNLTAHQTYYCPKRSNLDQEKLRRCPKCKVVGGADHQCGGVSSTATGWKCPCCPVTSPTATQAQKHMETHSGVKAFLCTICRYKGNTLRGMRTHIRMHFDKKPTEVNEENFISCIIDEPSIIKLDQGVDERKENSPIREGTPCNGEGVKVKEEELEKAVIKNENREELIDVDNVTIKTEPKLDDPPDDLPDDLSINNNKKFSPRPGINYNKYYNS